MVRGLRQLLRRRRKGQTIIYIVLLMVILLVVGIFLFDLQYFVRLRARTQTAVDASSLVGARWQGKSLNMVGEMNLVRACTVMMDTTQFNTGIDPAVDPAAHLAEADALVSQIQTRIMYTGPLIGYAASQQAAKNNRLRPIDEYAEAMTDFIDENLTEVDGDPSPYGQMYAPQMPYNGYNWLPEYKKMLELIRDEGMAVKAVNTRYLAGNPRLVGPGANLLMQKDFYRAVWAFDFCWFINRGIISSQNYDFGGITLDTSPRPFFPGSEFLCLYLGFVPRSLDGYRTTLQPFVSSRGNMLMPSSQPGLGDLNWAVFDNASRGWSDEGEYGFVDKYLRSPMRDEYIYGGAAVRMICESEPSLLSGRWDWEHGQTEAQSTSTSLGNPLTGEGALGTSAARLRAAEDRMDNLRRTASVDSSSAAKPFGTLAGGRPHLAAIVLPVFEEVRLIPAALVIENDYDRDYEFWRFLTEYFGNEDYPNVPDDIRNRFSYYILAIEAFQSHDSYFHERWEAFEAWRLNLMAGEDGELGTDDDIHDPCVPIRSHGGGGHGGGPIGGPSIIH